MPEQKDRHLEAPGEANRDKHINFLAEEKGDIDPASEKFSENDPRTENEVDNGFFTDDNNELQSKEGCEEEKSKRAHNEKVTSIEPDTKTPTLGDKITVNSASEDILTPVKDDVTPYENEDDQAH